MHLPFRFERWRQAGGGPPIQIEVKSKDYMSAKRSAGPVGVTAKRIDTKRGSLLSFTDLK
jgi:hypothetical protein